MTNDSTITMFTSGRQSLDSTFKAVKLIMTTHDNDFKAFVIMIAADVAVCHKLTSAFESFRPD